MEGVKTESELVQQAQAGDAAAVGELYERYINQLYRFFYWQTNNHRQVAEDLTHDTFIEAAQSLPSFQARSSFKNWLYAIAKRQLNKWLRRKYQAPELALFATLADTPDWIDPISQERQINQLEKLLAQLSERESAVLRCRYLRNLSVIETAQQLKLSPANVKVISHRSIRKLRNALRSNLADTIVRYEFIKQHAKDNV